MINDKLPPYTRWFVYFIFSLLFVWIYSIEALIDEREPIKLFFNRSLILTFSFTALFIVSGSIARYLRKQLKKWEVWTNTVFFRFLIDFVLVVLQTILLVIIIFLLTRSSLVSNFSKLTIEGDRWLIYAFPFVIFSIVWLVEAGLDLFVQRHRLRLQNEKLEKQQLLSQLQSLKNQLRPHFLFNNLNTLSNLVYQAPDKADEYIRKLSQVYRYVLEVNEEVVTTLAKELAFLKAYLDLQHIRFGGNLTFENRISKFQENWLVPPLSLELLAENALKHNIISAQHPLHLTLEIEDAFLIVKNTYQPKKVQMAPSQKGLSNLMQRLELLDVKGFEVAVDEKDFVVRFPLIRPEA